MSEPSTVGPRSAVYGDSPNLDLLRSIAVSFVVLSHLVLFFGKDQAYLGLVPLGRWGVLMFFVHTSLVLMLSLERQSRRQRGEALFWGFMLRRVFRILPLSCLVVLVIVLLKLPVAHLREGRFVGVPLTGVGVLENLLLVQNLTHTDSVEAPLWSLPFEMQMYLLLPGLYWMTRRLKKPVAVFVGWVIIALACRLAWRLALRYSFDLVEFVPCFLSGIAAYALICLRSHSPRWPFAVWVGVISACTAFYLARPTIIVGWVCCLAIGVAAAHCADMKSTVLARISHLIARYSYGVYLLHFICIWVGFVELRGLPLPGRVAAFLLTTAFLPVLLYHTVEAPMIRFGSRLAGARQHAVAPST